MASRSVAIACGVASIVGALALPLWHVGIGWFVAGVAVAAAGLVARMDEPPPAPEPARTGGDRAWRIAAATAALILLAVPAVRAAPWLAAICVGTGVALGAYAVVGGRTWRDLLTAVFAWAPATVPALEWVATGSRGRKLPQALAGLAVGVVLVLIFGGLFVNADSAFADLISGWLTDFSPAELARVVVGLLVAGLAAAVTAYLATRTRAERVEREWRRPLGTVEWAMPVAMLDVLFAIFVFVQITVLFGGRDYVLRAGGPDFADYARSGFAALIVVTALSLAVLAGLALWARRDTPGQRLALQVLGGLLCLLTLVVVASALTRLLTYVNAYGFTRTRMLGFAGEVWLGSVVLLVGIAGVGLRATWLPRAVVGAWVAVVLALAAVNPEALMARTHIQSRDHGGYTLDYNFLGSLSTDAADDLRPCYVTTQPWYAWSYSYSHAMAFCNIVKPGRDEDPGQWRHDGQGWRVPGQPPIADMGRTG